MDFVNISTYRFTPLFDTQYLRTLFQERCGQIGMRGTAILSPEGINIGMAGTREQVDQLADFLNQFPKLKDLVFKESLSEFCPFNNLRIKIKTQLVPCDDEQVDPLKIDAKRITPKELKRWYDEGRDFTILDTRNDYEFEIGTFKNAVQYDLARFRQIGDHLKDEDKALKSKPLVTFCTGGIRCERAAPEAMLAGFDEVYQLDGGILKYFEEVGGDHYDGDCFVFDQRVAVKPDLSVAK